MQRKKNISLSISLLLLLTLTVAFYALKNNDTFKVDKNIFKVDDWQKIDRISMESSSSTVEVKFDGVRWKVNDVYHADAAMVDILFATLQQAEPKRPVSEKLSDSITQELKKSGVKVSLYEGDILQQQFIAGGNRGKTQSFFDKPDDQPYLMEIPGYRVYTSGIFEMDENGWREKRIFAFNWRNFLQLRTVFPGHPEMGFVINMDESGRVNLETVESPDTTRLNDYLDFVSLVAVDQFLPIKKDSLSRLKPLVTISVKDIGSKEYQLSIYPRESSSTNFPGLLQEQYPILLENRKVRNLLQEKSFLEGK